MKNAETNEKSLYIGGVNAGSNAVGTVGKLATAGNTVVATPGSSAPSNVSSAKGMKGATTVPSATSAKATNNIPSRVLPFVSTIGLPTAAAGLGAAGLSYGFGKYMESKGLGSTFDKGANKNELKHRTGGLGSSSSNKSNSYKRRHN